jgi:hypothetical protein
MSRSERQSRLTRLGVVAAAIGLTTVGTPSPRVVADASHVTGLRAAAARQAGSSERVMCVEARLAGAYAVEGSVKAVRAWLRPRTLTNQSGTYRLTPGNYAIGRTGPVSLGAERGTEERRLARMTQDQCGTPMAEQTWLTIVNFPRSTLAAGSLALLTTRTSEGWRVVYEGRARG